MKILMRLAKLSDSRVMACNLISTAKPTADCPHADAAPAHHFSSHRHTDFTSRGSSCMCRPDACQVAVAVDEERQSIQRRTHWPSATRACGTIGYDHFQPRPCTEVLRSVFSRTELLPSIIPTLVPRSKASPLPTRQGASGHGQAKPASSSPLPSPSPLHLPRATSLAPVVGDGGGESDGDSDGGQNQLT